MLTAALLACAVLLVWPAPATSRSRGVTVARVPDLVPGVADTVTVLDLLGVAVECGAGVPHALHRVGQAVGGPMGADLERAGSALLLGAGWAAAWADSSPGLRPVSDALAPAWQSGTAAAPALRAAADDERRRRHRAGREGAARLGVRLVLPLGVCFLPAFVLVGLIPVLVSLAGALFG